jgi:hypothetical protein
MVNSRFGRAGLRMYAVVSYSSFVVASLAAFAFLADVGPWHVVDGVTRGPAWTAVAVDAGRQPVHRRRPQL